jgi:hypothetical protein
MIWLVIIAVLMVACIYSAFKIPNESINFYKRKKNVP